MNDESRESRKRQVKARVAILDAVDTLPNPPTPLEMCRVLADLLRDFLKDAAESDC